jgi:hypothetical protein
MHLTDSIENVKMNHAVTIHQTDRQAHDICLYRLMTTIGYVRITVGV